MYREEELELRAKQLLYMRDREELLDEQLMLHKDVMQHQTNDSLLQTNMLQLLQVHCSVIFIMHVNQSLYIRERSGKANAKCCMNKK